MIVTVGKHIKVDSNPYYFECSAETPGLVTVQRRFSGSRAAENQIMGLPGNLQDAERFIAAYRRVLKEDIGYRTQEFEPPSGDAA